MSEDETRRESHKSIEDEIKNVNDLCGQLENYVKQPKKPKEHANIFNNHTKALVTIYDDKKYKKKERGRANISMDFNNYSSRKDKPSPSVKLNSAVKNKNKSVDNREQTNNTISNSEKKKLMNKPSNKEENKQQVTTPAKAKPKVDEMLLRFKEFQIGKNNKIQELKRKFQGMEEKNIKKVPEINKKSKKLATVSEDFLTRMEKHKEASDQKKKEMIEKEMKKKDELEKQLLEEMKKNNKKLDKDAVKEMISSMYEWENNRKDKLKHLKEKECNKEFEECTFKPDINKNSAKIATTKKQFIENEETIDRLYKQDVIKRKHKQEILEDIYAPSFNPILNNAYRGNIMTESAYPERKVNALNVEYATNKDNNMIEDMLRERVKLFRNKNVEN